MSIGDSGQAMVRQEKKGAGAIDQFVCFVNVNEKDREKVFQISGIVRYLFWLGKPAVVRDEEIVALRESLKYTMSAVEVTGLKVGDSMQIPSGPFSGKEGVVKEIKKNSLQLVLTELGVLITLTKAETA